MTLSRRYISRKKGVNLRKKAKTSEGREKTFPLHKKFGDASRGGSPEMNDSVRRGDVTERR